MALDSTNSFPPSPAFLSSVEVEDLFGYQNIGMDFESTSSIDGRQINILYGENGQGKSTILRLIYSIISSQDGKGLKNWVNKVPFSRVNIRMTNGANFEVSKNVGQRKGLTINCSGPGYDKTFKLPENDRGLITSEVHGTQVNEYIEFTDNNSPQIFLITDRRQYFTNSKVVQGLLNNDQDKMTFDPSKGWELVKKSGEDDVVSVEGMSKIIQSIFRDEVFDSGVFGQQSSDHIFRQLVEHVSSEAGNVSEPSRAKLLKDIDQIDQLVRRASDLGVLPRFDAEFYRSKIENLAETNFSRLSLVVVPFLESTKARVDAVIGHVDRMRSFLSELNHFYRDKEFRFDIMSGFSVRSSRGAEPIRLEWLSSGERQLFIIMSSIFLTQSSSAIVLIDEPELSLNVMWQREFVDALRRISIHSPVQYILASHSLEILSSEAGVVRELKNRK